MGFVNAEESTLEKVVNSLTNRISKLEEDLRMKAI
jgi:hypothetical protein